MVENRSKKSDPLSELELKLGYSFDNRALLETALTHKSATRYEEEQDYELLEFLGDAVLDLVVADLLIEYHPENKEGELSKMRAALVNTQSLADTALKLDLNLYVRLSESESANEGATKPSILADVFESIVGAIYKDSSFEVAFKCIRGLFSEQAQAIVPRDPKTELQELLHKLSLDDPQYKLENQKGPEHKPVFVSSVTVGAEVFGLGEGGTKKASQQEAAAKAIEKLKALSSPA